MNIGASKLLPLGHDALAMNLGLLSREIEASCCTIKASWRIWCISPEPTSAGMSRLSLFYDARHVKN